MPSIQISVNHPDNPLNIPAYDGPDVDAHKHLAVGVYDAHDEDGLDGTLLVHFDGWSAFEYAACAMMGCEWGGVPHNHTEAAML